MNVHSYVCAMRGDSFCTTKAVSYKQLLRAHEVNKMKTAARNQQPGKEGRYCEASNNHCQLLSATLDNEVTSEGYTAALGDQKRRSLFVLHLYPFPPPPSAPQNFPACVQSRNKTWRLVSGVSISGRYLRKPSPLWLVAL